MKNGQRTGNSAGFGGQRHGMPFKALLAIGVTLLFLALPASAMDLHRPVPEMSEKSASASVFRERPACIAGRTMVKPNRPSPRLPKTTVTPVATITQP